MPSKTRSARLQRRKSKKQSRSQSRSRSRSQSGGHGGFPISDSRQKYWDGYYLYAKKFKDRELARRAALKGPPGYGDPCVQLLGPRSQCKDYPKLKCSRPVFVKPTENLAACLHLPAFNSI